MTTPGVLRVQREYVRRQWPLFRYALSNGLATADDVFARAATHDRYSASELAGVVKRLLADGPGAELRSFMRSLRAGSFRYLVSLQANQPQRPDREEDAAALLEAMIVHGSRGALTDFERETFLDLLAAQRRRDDLEKYLDVLGRGHARFPQRDLLRANASHPFATGKEDRAAPGVAEWLRLFNWMLVREGLEPVDLAPGDEAPLDRLLCAASGIVEDGPLVSVIVPTHESGPSLGTALESLLVQSYRRLEILIMDDGSRPEVAESLRRWEARDSRIKVVLLPDNRGPYYARNTAVAEYAHGDYLTVHDDDDWSHPRKIELQVAHLEAEPAELANMSLAVRTTPNLWLVRRSHLPEFVHANYSSLMIRRSAMERLGYWDLVNRGADGELRDRIVALSGHPIPTAGRAPASILRIRQESLTFGELNKGYVDPRRRWYTLSHKRWHEQALAAGGDLHLPPDDNATRPFPVPADMVGRRAGRGAFEVDVLYVTDYRFPGGNSTLTCNEIEIMLAHGLTVGLLQLDSPVVGPYSQLHPRAYALASHPAARVLTIKDAVRAPLTIVRHPTVLQFAEPVRSQVTTDRVVLIVNHAPINPDGESAYFDMDQVVANCRTILGHMPVVAPESGLIRGLLDGLVDPALLAPENWTGVASLNASEPRTAEPSRQFRMGRHSRDHPGKWPDADVLRQVYPTDGSRDVRVLGGVEYAEKRLGEKLDDAWTVYEFGSRPASEFLAELDFWVYFHSPELYESFGMATLEAMAAGLVVVLPPSMEATFGDGAVYCDPADVGARLEALWADPEAYRRQSERALATARDRFGEASLLARLDSYRN